MASQYSVRSRAKTFLIVVSTVPLFFAAFAAAQDDSFQSLSAEAEALAGMTNASTYIANASDLTDRAVVVLTGSQLQSVQDAVGSAAANWLRRTDLAATLSEDEIGFLVAQGLGRIAPSERGDLAVVWLLQPGAVSSLSADTVNLLSAAADGKLSAAQRETLIAASRAGLGDVAQLSFEELKEHVDVRTAHLYPATEAGRASKRQAVIQWSEDREPGSLGMGNAEWVLLQLVPRWLGEYPVTQELTAEWDSHVTAPRSGEYIFSLSPLNLSREEGEGMYLRLWYTLRVNDQIILEATPESWQVDSQPVQLSEAQATSLQLTLKYELRGYPFPLPASGQLYWSGPGLSKQIIGPSFLSLADSNEQGVKLTCSRRNPVGTHDCSVVVDSIDQVIGKQALCTHERLIDKYLEFCVGEAVSSSYMNEAVAAATKADVSARVAHPFTSKAGYRGIANNASSALRRRMATELAARPPLLALARAEQIVPLYDILRFGAERQAVDMLGSWLAVHQADAPILSVGTNQYYAANVRQLRHLVIPLVMEHPESGQWLEEDYLTNEDGTCNVAAAEVLAYCYLVNSKMLDWIGKLDAMLDDDQLVGDQRAGWLVARAIAEEIRSCPQSYREFPGCQSLAAGFGWLDEAMLKAQSTPIKERVALVKLSRLAALGKIDEAEALIDQYPGLIAWKAKLEGLREYQLAAAEERSVAADKAFLAEMKRRHERADARGDTDAVAKYSGIIEQLEKQNP